MLTVAEAAQLADRSPQWVRDQIRANRLSAHEQIAGSRIRLLVDRDDLHRFLAEASPRPYRHGGIDDAPDPARDAVPAPASAADIGEQDRPYNISGSDALHMAMMLLARLDSENVQLRADLAGLLDQVSRLEAEIRDHASEQKSNDAFRMDTVLLVQLQSENDELRADSAELLALVARLHEEVRRLTVDQGNILETMRIVLDNSKEAKTAYRRLEETP